MSLLYSKAYWRKESRQPFKQKDRCAKPSYKTIWRRNWWRVYTSMRGESKGEGRRETKEVKDKVQLLHWYIHTNTPSFWFIFGGRCLICTLYNLQHINPLTPNDHYSGHTAPLPSKRCILYIYSTNTGTEYFKHDIYSTFFPLQNAVRFIILMYLVPVLFTFYIQSVLKLKK